MIAKNIKEKLNQYKKATNNKTININLMKIAT